jgi:hypothetical protein
MDGSRIIENLKYRRKVFFNLDWPSVTRTQAEADRPALQGPAKRRRRCGEATTDKATRSKWARDAAVLSSPLSAACVIPFPWGCAWQPEAREDQDLIHPVARVLPVHVKLLFL